MPLLLATAIYGMSTYSQLPQVAFLLFWTPGLSVAILTNILNIPEDLAKLCVDPLRVFTFFGLTGDSIVL